MTVMCKFIQKGLAIKGHGALAPCGQSEIDLGWFHSIKDLDNSELRVKNLEKFKNQIPKECQSCSLKEKVGLSSRRLFHKELFAQNDNYSIEFIDLHIGNSCNLKCRMCNPSLSSGWHIDAPLLKSKTGLDMPGFGKNIKNSHITDEFIEWIQNQKQLKFLIIKGGEPFFDSNFENLLDAIPNKSNLTLQIITNGTAITQRHLSKLKSFKKINILFSIEASGEMYKYIRGGHFEFAKVIENFQKVQSTLSNLVEHSWLYTANIYGVFDHNRTQKIIRDHFPKTQLFDLGQQVLSPDFLNPLILPFSSRKDLAARSSFDSFRDYILQDPRQTFNWSLLKLKNAVKNFITYTKALDQIRDENLISIEPRFGDIFDFSTIKEYKPID